MNTVLLWAMAVTSFIVTITGGVLLAVLLFYGLFRLIASIWERTSSAARNTREYLRNRDKFELFKRDVAMWDDLQRTNIEKCQRCEYRKKGIKGEGTDDGT